MTEALEKNIRKVVPYVPGEQPQNPDVIKLNTNENPYSPAPGVARVLKSMDADLLRLYPDPTNGCLVKALADYYELAEDQVFVGIGSDDVLSMSFLTFFNSGKPILFPNVTYSFYDVWADLYRIPYVTCALDDQMMIKKEDYFKENGGIVIPNPNAPTGVYEPLETFEEILQKNTDVVVIVDEAYVDFGAESMLPLIHKYDNLMVVQTFSKSRAMAGMRIGFAIASENLLVVQTFSKSRSMAGMRIGYAMGNKELIKALNDVKYSFNSYTMSRVALLCGVEAVNDKAYFEEHVKKICETREKTKKALAALGFSFPDSQSNFIFAAHKSMPAKEIFAALKARNIFVRYFNKPGIDNYLRITIGTDEQMQALEAALKEILPQA